MTLLSTVLGLAAIALSVAAVLSYQWVSLVPRLGIRTLYRVRALRIVVAATAVSLALAAARLSRSSRAWLYPVAVLALAPLSGALHAARILVPLDDPEHLDAADARIDGATMVVGSVIDGRAHAWQVRTLVPHHVVHDTVGGRPVVATWCAVCESGMVFDGTVDGRRLHFDPEGIWRRNMIMRDRETGTLWQQATGEGLIGPLDGTSLDVLGGRLMRWDAWVADHPDTTVVRDTTAAEWAGLLPRDLTARSLTDWGIPTAVTPPGLTADDDRLGPLTEVVGVAVAGQARAYPIAVLEMERTVTETVDGVPVVVSFDADRNGAAVSVAGRPAEFKRTRWLEWFEFHPDTSVYG